MSHLIFLQEMALTYEVLNQILGCIASFGPKYKGKIKRKHVFRVEDNVCSEAQF